MKIKDVKYPKIHFFFFNFKLFFSADNFLENRGRRATNLKLSWSTYDDLVSIKISDFRAFGVRIFGLGVYN